MEYVLLGMIIIIIAVGLYFARSSQDYIDEQNARIRQERERIDNGINVSSTSTCSNSSINMGG